ncbi:MAG: YgiQ family radical SAM protein [Spirochaetia bacterium]|nr:YgiQ family radical SAM protein [Spirochaetia bacterium]
MRDFLPISQEDMRKRGWDSVDFIIITGDAYVDHPSFCTAIVSRVLEAEGWKVGIIPQPDWKNPESVKVLGRPNIAFLINAGNMDSMVANFSSRTKRRSRDQFTPGGVAGKRPDRAVIVYTSMAKAAYKGIPVVIGGIEASLRRLAHYDYWSDTLRRSILLDSKADMLIYGMGEKPLWDISRALREGLSIKDIKNIRGTVVKSSQLPEGEFITLPSYEEMQADRLNFARSFAIQYRNTDPFSGKMMVEKTGTQYVIQNPPAHILTMEEMDKVYALPYMGAYHPVYEAQGGVPAIKEVEFSLISARGCFGSCNFCALTFHQGRIIQARSHQSITDEAIRLTKKPNFKGYINDVGGPTANFRQPACKKQLTSGACQDRRCLFPGPCPNLEVSHADYLALLRKLRALPGVKKVFIKSGIRFDYLVADKDQTFFQELCQHHISGQLKIAPEHICPRVLDLMGKPRPEVYQRFETMFKEENKRIGKKQYLIPYLISSHPGSDLKAAIELAEYLHQEGFIPDQVQDFYPTPGTVSTCMYYTGVNPLTMEKVYVPKSEEEKSLQRALLHFHKPENREKVRKALLMAGRKDLIGPGPKALIR